MTAYHLIKTELETRAAHLCDDDDERDDIEEILHTLACHPSAADRLRASMTAQEMLNHL